MPSREDNFLVTASVTRGTETRNLGIFDTFEGGETEAEDSKYNRGGLQPHESLGGKSEVGNVTIAKLFDAFMISQGAWLRAGVGNAEMVVNKQPIDDFGAPYGDADIYTGKLTAYTPPDHDASSSDGAQVELVLAPRGNVG